jgi:hypothetical protein
MFPHSEYPMFAVWRAPCIGRNCHMERSDIKHDAFDGLARMTRAVSLMHQPFR